MTNFSVSVIVPTFNRADMIECALDSILSQTRKPEEIIVVDDGSNDETKSLLKNKYPQIIYIYQDNSGVSAARNAGIKKSKGNWVAFLDSDDSWHSNKLAKQINKLSEHQEFVWCHTNETWYRNGVFLKQLKKHKKQGGYIYKECLPLCVISPSSSLIKKSVFSEIGLFDEQLPACEDYDMWLRISAIYPILFLEEALINKLGGHFDQLSKRHWGIDRFRIIALEKMIKSQKLNETDKKLTIYALKEKIDIFLKGSEKHGENKYSDRFRKLAKYYQ